MSDNEYASVTIPRAWLPRLERLREALQAEVPDHLSCARVPRLHATRLALQAGMLAMEQRLGIDG